MRKLILLQFIIVKEYILDNDFKCYVLNRSKILRLSAAFTCLVNIAKQSITMDICVQLIISTLNAPCVNVIRILIIKKINNRLNR